MKKMGLVLEGGGAKGAYHMGAYKALMEMGYHFYGIAGTSIGALNGALIAQGDWKKIYDLWYNASNKKVYGIFEDAFVEIGKGELNSDNAHYVVSVVGDIIKKKGIDTHYMKDLFYNILDEKKLRNSKVDLGIVTVKLPTFKKIELFKDEIPKGEIKSYLMASANFPLFQREENKDGVFVDGALKNNLPINMLPKRGIKKLIVIRTFGLGVVEKYNNSDLDITYIEPSKKLGNTLDFNREQSRNNLLLGYMDAYKTLKGYLGYDFCIIPLNNDIYYIDNLVNVSNNKILDAAKVMGYKNIDPKRFILEKLLPVIADYLDLGLEVSYEVLFLTFFEEIARTLYLDRAIIYKAEVFILEVKKAFFYEHKSFNRYKSLPKVVKSSAFLSSFVKSDFFYFIMDIFFS